MAKSKVYPLWLRVWHFLNAALFICLIITGLSLQYSGETSFLIEFETAIKVHNICGIILSVNYILFLIANFASGNYKHYFSNFNGLISKSFIQLRYYLIGGFKGEEKPFQPTVDEKFNPLQKITYLKIMYVAMPLLIISGFGLLFPEILIDEFLGESGLLYTALLHTIIGFLLSLFLIVHIYLGTTGTTVSENFRAILTGKNELEDK